MEIWIKTWFWQLEFMTVGEMRALVIAMVLVVIGVLAAIADIVVTARRRSRYLSVWVGTKAQLPRSEVRHTGGTGSENRAADQRARWE